MYIANAFDNSDSSSSYLISYAVYRLLLDGKFAVVTVRQLILLKELGYAETSVIGLV